MMMAMPIHAQEDDRSGQPTKLPPIPYFVAEDSARKFNVPLPFDWQNVSTDPNIAHFAHPDGLGDIYALPIDNMDAQAAAEAAIKRILGGDMALTARYSGRFQLDGNDWGKYAFASENGAFTAFTQTRDGTVYVLVYHYPKPDREFYFMAQNVVGDDVQGAVLTALRSIYPELPDTPTTESIVTLSNGDWTRQTYAIDDASVSALWQERGGVVYIALENGDGVVVDVVNKALFTSLFGFFITPQNTAYMVLGLAVTFGILAVFVVSLWARHRNLSRDAALVAELAR